MQNIANTTTGCGGWEHFSRRSFLRLAGLSGISWLTPLATQLARAAESQFAPAKSIILLWMEGAPSQLETFDPHPGKTIAYGSTAIPTRAKNIQIVSGFQQLADVMDNVSLVRALTSEEGDHERAIYNMKTGYRMDPTVLHPAVGSVICHQFDAMDAGQVDIPRHISILPGGFPARGGYLGDRYDAFKVYDPVQPVPDMESYMDEARQRSRLKMLEVANQNFSAGREHPSVAKHDFGRSNLDAALKMMSSEQLDAFDVSSVSASERLKYGDSPFGRGCLAGLRLIQAGVRCVEVTLSGWDTHANNHELQGERIKILDPALAALIQDLKTQDLLESTLVVCGGEFGRTPFLNGVGGRDHWPHGFTMALAGGGIQGGRVVGETNSDPNPENPDPKGDLRDSHSVADLHSTIYEALGIPFAEEVITPIGRPLKISEGKPIHRLLEV
ncbi:MAG: DUF1501 domain-containing protein [Pirellulaceae bacterium]